LDINFRPLLMLLHVHWQSKHCNRPPLQSMLWTTSKQLLISYLDRSSTLSWGLLKWNMILHFEFTVCILNHDWLPEWLIIRMIDYLNDWLSEWLIIWMIDYLNDWLSEWLTVWMIDYLNDWLSEWLIIWIIDCLNDWLSE
jgi:hypothetical protein